MARISLEFMMNEQPNVKRSNDMKKQKIKEIKVHYD